MFKLQKITTGIYLLTFDDHVDLVSHFMRYQEIYESPNDAFYNKPFEILDYHRWNIKQNKENYDFTYYSEWGGFNITLKTIREFYPLIKDKGSHDHFMYQISEYIVRDHGSDMCYLIGCTSGNTKTIEHEVAHGLFYTNKEYFHEMIFAINSMKSNVGKLKAILTNCGYRNTVFNDEIQAYVSTGLGSEMEKYVTDYEKRKFRKIFKKYTKNIDFKKNRIKTMCVSAEPAKFSGTTIYSAEIKDENGEVYHVLGYQNEAENLSKGLFKGKRPNAMILPIPAKELTRDNIIDTSGFKYVLNIYSKSLEFLRERDDYSRGIKLNNSYDDVSKSADVFESGSYTVILATHASQITEALERVPENKRPEISEELIRSLSELYPEWPIAICCFDGKIKPEPLLWKFKPRFENVLFAPAVDAHDGGAPKFDAPVNRSHKLAFYSYRMDEAEKANADVVKADFRYSEIPAEYDWMFSRNIKGAVFESKTDNGDFTLIIDDYISAGSDLKKDLKITVGG